MSDLGTPPPPPTPVKRSRTPFVVITLVLLLAVGGVGFTVFKVLTDKDEKKTTAEKEIVFPDQWDPRIEPYVKIASKLRDLDFEHPVEVRFLTEKEYVDERKTDEELTEEDRKEIEQYAGLYRASGLISGDVDLFKAFKDVVDSGSLAYYSTEEKRITVRGTKITPAVRSTLVHELVHVLQDQHFEIGTRSEELAKDAEDGDTDDNESVVLDAVIEGDASRIQSDYRDSLSAKDRKALDKSESGDREKDPYKGIPKVAVTLQLAPYTLGEAVVQAVAKEGGNEAVDDLFTDTPKHEAALVDAFEVISGDTDAEDVDVPSLEDGEEKFASGEFGSLTLFFVLAERIPVKTALAAADGWSGDKYVAYEKDGVSCVRMAYAGDTDDDTDAMFDALTAWKKAAPGAPITVERDGDELRLTSCDPGKKGPKGKDASQEALTLVASRTYLGINLMGEGLPSRAAGCVADVWLREVSIADLNDAEKAKDEAFGQRLRDLAATCR